jgi:hypothetical protein
MSWGHSRTHATASGKPSGSRARFWAYPGLALAMVLVSAVQRVQEDTLPGPLDLAQGAIFDAGAYEAPPGCPQRLWSVGEYLPRACLRENTFGLTAGHLGLEPLENGHRQINWRHTRIWVRHGSDALGVVCAWRAACRVLTVVDNRFSPAVARRGEKRAESVYSVEPAGFTVSFFLQSLLWTLPLGVAGLAVVTQWGKL